MSVETLIKTFLNEFINSRESKNRGNIMYINLAADAEWVKIRLGCLNSPEYWKENRKFIRLSKEYYTNIEKKGVMETKDFKLFRLSPEDPRKRDLDGAIFLGELLDALDEPKTNLKLISSKIQSYLSERGSLASGSTNTWFMLCKFFDALTEKEYSTRKVSKIFKKLISREEYRKIRGIKGELEEYRAEKEREEKARDEEAKKSLKDLDLYGTTDEAPEEVPARPGLFRVFGR